MENHRIFDDSALSQYKRMNGVTKPGAVLASPPTPRALSQLQNRSDVENAEEERHRRHGEADRPRSPDLAAEDSGRRKPALVRSKTFDHSLLSQTQCDAEIKIERKKSQYSQLSKPNSHYHKIFKEISKDELLRQSYPCALQKDMLYQGRLFVSENWVCFHSKVFGKDTKIAIPVASVIQIKKTKTAILVPNALVIATATDRHVFVSFLSRDTTYKILMSMCLHLEEKSPCSSPLPSSAGISFRSGRPAGFPLCDLSDLDGAVRQGGPDMDESSRSDSSPECEKVSEFSATLPPFLEVLKTSERTPGLSGPGTPPSVHLHKDPQLQLEAQRNSSITSSELLYDPRTMKPRSLNMLLFIYLFLVCVLVLSSFFMALKIVSLEQRLTTLGSMTEFSHHENECLRANSEVNAEFYSELTLNLLKLEKVQRNLQRLLEESE
ncbi:GRAM domain-containing protein 2B isoform X2 [Hypomesus transpacificus]|uniref:GRAM domain-containing protein 2B isoform X2 n=1 Tax=Hypomesus transpacificus TaxID=137520 RepID=UPI001F07E126|nr:GRAM domain-containing protein 2B isoform X2 [Hypomesus transpacificus]